MGPVIQRTVGNRRDEGKSNRRLKREEMEMISELIAAREALGWTQKDLADRIGMKQPAIARFKGVTTAPSIETIKSKFTS
jgi:ribosome-binding protein aMBF1 (putative translation factor)